MPGGVGTTAKLDSPHSVALLSLSSPSSSYRTLPRPIPISHTNNSRQLPPPAKLDSHAQNFPPFANLPGLGRGNASGNAPHGYAIPSINTENQGTAGARMPMVQGYSSLPAHQSKSIYNLTHQNDQSHAQMPNHRHLLLGHLPAVQPSQEQPPQPPHMAPGQQSQQNAPNTASRPVVPPPPQQVQSQQLPPQVQPAQPPVQPAQDQAGKNLALTNKQHLAEFPHSQSAPESEKPSSSPQQRRSPAPEERAEQRIPQGLINRSSSSSMYKPLNVKDALLYLDQVKMQFYSQADVYNNFLDIMKDFKSQSIDTPGVIKRVSTLFRGHPNLIQGFNTFLPPGYRIECSLDPSDPNAITVTTPMCETTHTSGGDQVPGAPVWREQAAQPMGHFGLDQQPPAPVQGHNPFGHQLEFNHAILYVNKIKTRFANQPDIYKQFLEILQTYQCEQKPIGEVYEQVTLLFANSPDLLDDFKRFLPDRANQQHFNGRTDGALYPASVSQLPPLGSFQPATGVVATEQQRNYLFVAQEAAESKDAVGRKGSEHYDHEQNYNDGAQYSCLRGAQAPQQKHKTADPSRANATLVSGIPEPVPPSAMAKSSSLLEELAFFDKVKRAIGNKQTYNEFLKMLNLFSQDIIDKDTLVERVELFLGDNHVDLVNWFKQFVGWEQKTQHIEDITFKKHQIELSLCRAYGPSYRQLPKVETQMPCSGRDEMCWEVLNDEWVGHPTWASEDSGFISHRKNQYEEILFKIEEERLEFDYYMEANLRTIQTLETIANRIANMMPEQKANFKVPPGLGHTSQTIYKKVIRKIYDKDRGFEVIDALHENPAVAVPVVLKRLKQKDEEWKCAQREWNKVWREMEQKLFYKSLDHLGLTFKQADKKLLTAKQMVSEISTVKIEQQNKRLHPLTRKPQEQLNYVFSDRDVIFDILHLSHFYVHHSSNYSLGDREKLGGFFKHFVGLLFGIGTDEIDAGLAARAKERTASASSERSDENGTAPDAGIVDHVVSKKRGRETDLLRGVLKNQSKSRKEEVGGSLASEEDDSDAGGEQAGASDFWIQTASLKFSLDEVRLEEKRDLFNFFCNTTIYVFVRHFRTLYERLLEIKQMDAEICSEIASRRLPQFAKDLNLVSHQLEDLGVEIVASRSCYAQVLALAERLLDGEIEHQWFEESLRQAYCNKAYKCYTLDKVVQSMVKYMHTMITDSKTVEMVLLYEKDRKCPSTTARDQILYRIQVRALMSAEENMFKVAYLESSAQMNIQFVGFDDLTIKDHANAEEMYNYYMTSYVMSHPTEGVPISKIHMPFHKSFIQAIDEEQCEGVVASELRMSICENSYRLFFEKGTYDEFTAKTLYTRADDATAASAQEKLNELTQVLLQAAPWDRDLSKTARANHDASFRVLLDQGAAAYKSTGVWQSSDAAEQALTVAAEPEAKEAAMETDTAGGSFRVNPDATIDADTTVVQDMNDTTIQQDANDTTMVEEGSFRAE